MLASVEASGSALASWVPLVVIFSVFVLCVAALFVAGRGPIVARIPNALERLTGIPGWAAATVGMALTGLLIAGQGFYSDVAWHVALGRDEILFTAPHTAIVLGLGMIAASSVLAAFTHHLTTGRLPWSALPLAALGAVAVAGFPADELWHAAYGVDVTMWSPTHMMMIVGAALTGLACWLVLGEAGVRPGDSRWSRGVHVVCAWLVLQGLIAPLGEFVFGVPQFGHLFHPILLCVAGALMLVSGRLVLGPWWSLGIVAFNALMNVSGFPDPESPVAIRPAGLLVVAAIAVELLGRTRLINRPTRFALASGLAVGTVGLAAEWVWNLGAHQPWNAALFPSAVVLGVVAALAASVLGLGLAAGVKGDASLLPSRGLAAAAVVGLLVALALPLPRTVGEASAEVRLEAAGDGTAFVEATLTPPDAAEDAHWFQATAWQGGTLELADMIETGTPGVYRSAAPIPVDGRYKSLLRLHKGNDMVAVPLYFPADPEIGEPAISAVDRQAPFERESIYLLRETREGPSTAANLMAAAWVGIAVLWSTAFALAVIRLAQRAPRRTDSTSTKSTSAGSTSTGSTESTVPA